MVFFEKPFVQWSMEERVEWLERQYKEALEAYRNLNAFITLRDWEDVFNDFEPTRGLLRGLLIPIKDNISTKGIVTTCGSRILHDYIPPYDAHVVEVLKREGAIIMGKTNMDEFAMGNTGETSFYGPVKNPWDLGHVPGGSSSGSAAAVAFKGMLALGSDTGGSVRMPASHCGVLGLKPTYGMVSRYGLISYADSLEQIGPFARFSRDLALLYYIITEYDERDITLSSDSNRDRLREELVKFVSGGYEVEPDFTGLNFCLPINLVNMADEKVLSVFSSIINFIRENGGDVEEIEIGFLESALPAYYVIAMVEASSNLSRYDGSNYALREVAPTYWDSVKISRIKGFGDEVKRRIIMGGFASSKGFKGKYYVRALKVRRLIKNLLVEILSKYNYIILPTSPSLPPKFGEIVGPKGYIQDMYTVIPNLTGHPAISIPGGFVGRLPVGFQIIGKYFSDADLIFLASRFENFIYDPTKCPEGD